MDKVQGKDQLKILLSSTTFREETSPQKLTQYSIASGDATGRITV